MTITIQHPPSLKPGHDWLRQVNIAYMPGPTTPLLMNSLTVFYPALINTGTQSRIIHTTHWMCS